MSAHKQDYVFQVTIHALWGYCLAGFSLFRLLTYFFLWVSPPFDSVMPSRPPTEGLAAFCLACGGVLFFLSDEEIAYAAMRHAYDDGFAFLCWVSICVSLPARPRLMISFGRRLLLWFASSSHGFSPSWRSKAGPSSGRRNSREYRTLKVNLSPSSFDDRGGVKASINGDHLITFAALSI